MKRATLLWHGNIRLLIFLIGIYSCNSGNKDSIRGAAKITTGKTIEAANQIIPIEGGQIVVDQPGSPIDGLSIDVPGDAYEDDRNFKISYSSITNYDCGPFIHPLTPLIRISNGGGYANDVMTVTIPVQVPIGQFAMAFLYNDRTGKLEGLPLAESEPDHVTIATKNFSNTNTANPGGLNAGVYGGKDIMLSELIVSAVDEKILLQDFHTFFEPKEDNWQFGNEGSFIAPRGQCSGNSIGMLWYYSEKKLHGSPPLYTRFDNDDNEPKTPNFWQDDVLAYKFCAMLQAGGVFSEENTNLYNWQKMDATRTMKAFSYALRATNEPQFVAIYDNDYKVAHAIVVYAIEHGDLLVCDPNTPWKKESRIRYDPYSHTYLDYSTASISSGEVIPFKQFYYLAKTAIVSWDKAAEYWKAIADKTIGEGKFPDYNIYALNDKDEFVPMTDNFVVPLGGRLTLSIRCKDADADFQVYYNNGMEMQHEGNSVILPVADLQRIGICVVSAGSKSWIGFKWFTVKVKRSFDDQPQIDQPASGKISLDLYIDGVKVQIDSASYSIEFDAISIQGWGPRLQEGIYAWPHYVKVHARNWKGIGKYQLDNGGEGTYLWQYHPYPADMNNPSYINVTTWRYGELEGKFYFEAIDNQGARKTIDGTFHR